MLRFSAALVSSCSLSKATNVDSTNHKRPPSWGRILKTSSVLLMMACLGSLPSLGTSCGTTWNGPATGGLWSHSADWTAGLPNSTTDVCIDNGNPQHSAVTLDISGAQAHNLTIDSDDSLSF